MWEPAQMSVYSKRKIKMARRTFTGGVWVPKLNRKPNGREKQYDRSG